MSTALTRLKERGLVEHESTYWAVTGDESRLAAYDGYARATSLFDEQLGALSRESRREHAPDAPHPSVEEDDG